MRVLSARGNELREVLDIRQAADYLGISGDTLYRYASEGFIPAFKLGNRWRFRRSRLDEWMDRQSGLVEQPAPKLVREEEKADAGGSGSVGEGFVRGPRAIRELSNYIESMSEAADPTLVPQTTLGSRAGRLVWGMVWALLYRPSPRPFHAWRAMLLRAFGGKLGARCHFYPGSKVWAPWNLRCEDRVTLADGAEVYNPSPIYFGSHATVSQGAYVCGATHLYNEPEFRMVSYAMRIGAYAWICARAIVGPGVNVGEGAVLGLGSVATKDLEAFGVYVGFPARKVKERSRCAVGVREDAGPSLGAKNAPGIG